MRLAGNEKRCNCIFRVAGLSRERFIASSFVLRWGRGSGRIRTADTEIFNLLLYQLSYRAIRNCERGVCFVALVTQGESAFLHLALAGKTSTLVPMHARVLIVFLWLCCDLNSWAVELVSGPTVVVTDTTAVIRWHTDVECGTRVRFGLSEDKLDGKAGDGVAVAHEVTLAGLQPDKAYAYSVGTARQQLKTNIFITAKSGAPAQERGILERIKDAITGKTRPDSSPKAVPPPVGHPAPPTEETWGSVRTLQDHFDRHGADFRAASPDDYARQAWAFLQRARSEGLPAKVDDTDGTLRVWDPKTGAFAAYNRDGTTKTYFKPGSPDYFARQPGSPVKLKRPAFQP